MDDRQTSKDADNNHLRDAAYVNPPETPKSESVSDSDPEDNIPLARMIKKISKKEKRLRISLLYNYKMA